GPSLPSASLRPSGMCGPLGMTDSQGFLGSLPSSLILQPSPGHVGLSLSQGPRHAVNQGKGSKETGGFYPISEGGGAGKGLEGTRGLWEITPEAGKGQEGFCRSQ
ncbi:hypothetical protein P7K49_028742, partial [Saguinus oedipus]